MKKLIALIAILALLLSMPALAEEAGAADDGQSGATEVIENKPSYKGKTTAIGKTGLSFLLPEDWKAAEAPDGVNGDVYSSDDEQTALTVVIRSGVLDDLVEQYARAAEDGMFRACSIANINGREWVMITTGDNIQHYYQTQLDDGQILSFVYVTAAPGDEPECAVEMVGTVKKR